MVFCAANIYDGLRAERGMVSVPIGLVAACASAPITLEMSSNLCEVLTMVST
jgi:hypothetical protein